MNIGFSYLRSVVSRRIFGMFVLCALLPVSTLTAVTIFQVYGTIHTSSQERLRQVTKSVGMTLAGGLYLMQQELSSLSHTDTKSATARHLRSAPNETDAEQHFKSVTVYDGRHGVSLLGPLEPPPVLSEADEQHLSGGNALLFKQSPTNLPESFMMVFRADSGHDGRLLVARLNLDYLWILARNSLPTGVDLCITDSTGNVLFSSLPPPPSLVAETVKRHAVSTVGQFIWERSGEKSIVNYWTIFLKPLYAADSWIVVASQREDVVLAPVHRFLRTFLLVCLLTMIVVGYLSTTLIRKSLNPLDVLKDAAQNLSHGDLGTRVVIASGDEFEELARMFNGMADHLQRQFITMQETGQLVQQILSAVDRAGVVNVVMAARLTALPCDLLALSLEHPAVGDAASTYRCRTGEEGGNEIVELLSTFGRSERSLLAASPDVLQLADTEPLSPLLMPVREPGVCCYYLFPFMLKGRLAGVLTIGYRERPIRIDEELTRARGITNEIAVALEKIRLIEELNQLNWGTIRSLANAVDAKSPWTAGHSERVTRLAVLVGRTLGLAEHEVELIQIGGMFHDIGKLAVPEEILDKRGALTDEEYAVIRSHPEAGARILEPISAYEQVVPMVLQHHERFDGSGYPYGLAGEDISIGGRILAVADAYDALYSERPYRKGWHHGEVLEYIRSHAGEKFDPKVVEAISGVCVDSVYGSPTSGGEPMSAPEVCQI